MPLPEPAEAGQALHQPGLPERQRTVRFLREVALDAAALGDHVRRLLLHLHGGLGRVRALLAEPRRAGARGDPSHRGRCWMRSPCRGCRPAWCAPNRDRASTPSGRRGPSNGRRARRRGGPWRRARCAAGRLPGRAPAFPPESGNWPVPSVPCSRTARSPAARARAPRRSPPRSARRRSPHGRRHGNRSAGRRSSAPVVSVPAASLPGYLWIGARPARQEDIDVVVTDMAGSGTRAVRAAAAAGPGVHRQDRRHAGGRHRRGPAVRPVREAAVRGDHRRRAVHGGRADHRAGCEQRHAGGRQRGRARAGGDRHAPRLAGPAAGAADGHPVAAGAGGGDHRGHAASVGQRHRRRDAHGGDDLARAVPGLPAPLPGDLPSPATATRSTSTTTASRASTWCPAPDRW